MSVVINRYTPVKFVLNRISVFSSDEWFHGQTKKYRSVFDCGELDYIRCELSFYNKVQEQEWTCSVWFKCYHLLGDKKEEVCALENKVTVRPADQMITIRDGWGDAVKGRFWSPGEYLWEVFIDDEKAGDASFFINNIGVVDMKYNPYFVVNSLKCYSGNYNGFEQKNRTYLNTMDRSKTEYLWIEFSLRNKQRNGWYYELFFNIYDPVRQLKGQVVRDGFVSGNHQDYSYAFDAGWGNEKPGSWKSAYYYIDVVFMSTIVASGIIAAGDRDIPGELNQIFRLPG